MDPMLTVLVTAVAGLAVIAAAAVATVALLRGERADVPHILRELPAVVRAFLRRR